MFPSVVHVLISVICQTIIETRVHIAVNKFMVFVEGKGHKASVSL